MKSDKEKKIYIKPFCIGLFVLKENISFLKIYIYFYLAALGLEFSVSSYRCSFVSI